MFVFFELGTRIAYVIANVFPFFVEVSYEALNLSLTMHKTRVFRAAGFGFCYRLAGQSGGGVQRSDM